MKERPILFSGEMVKAIIAGTKTQTRRIVKPQPVVVPGWATGGLRVATHDDDGLRFATGTYRAATYAIDCLSGWWQDIARRFSPYGAPGDRLWVRETFYSERAEQPGTGAVRWGYTLDGTYRSGAIYRADEDADVEAWRPAIHMPRCCSRIDLEIMAVRVERLQDITEEDARAEGVASEPCKVACCDQAYRHGFERLWQEINGERAPWSSNPWVWVVSFRRVRP